MARQSGPLKSSCNSGEFSPDLKGKVTLKQYYNAGLQFKNVEPVPQSGFRLMPGTALVESARSGSVRHVTLPVDSSLSYTLIFSPGWCDIYRNDRVNVAHVEVSAITSANLPELEFYAEANTVGIFHEDLETVRMVRDGSDDTVWNVDLWPYAKIPDVDLGGSYAKTNDIWKIYVRWSENLTPTFGFTVNGESTPGISLGTPINVSTNTDWNNLAAAIASALEALPSLGTTVTVTQATNDSYKEFTVTFSGNLAGAEYQLDAQCVNSAAVSVLSYHIQFGETEGEPLISSSAGWFAGMGLAQDRAVYFGPKARRAAIAMSKSGEYFDLAIDAAGDAAARLEALRSQTSERILSVYEDTYLLALTDAAVWFASNRTIKKGEPVNWVRSSSNAVEPHVPPFDMEGRIYYVSGNNSGEDDQDQGQTLQSMAYDDGLSKYPTKPEHLLSTHLVDRIKGAALQKKVARNDAARWWLRRSDGRLICAMVIKDQDIMALVEWIPAAGGAVKGLSVDGQNQVWLTVDRGGVLSHEVMEEQEINLFHGARRGSTDLAGSFSGLDLWEGKEVWARADGYILGPFTVSGGAIDLGDPYSDVIAGLWQPPVHESMPYYRLLPNDEILLRPGRIHSVDLNLIDTESVAIGANGSTPKNVSLLKTTDPVDAPLPAKTDLFSVIGIPGHVVGPTVVITQTRPGKLRVRDYVPEAAL